MGSATVLGQNGFLGQETLRRFRVILDYPGKRMFLRPNARYSREYEFNMAGLTLNTKPDGTLLVLDVVEDSPGWKQQIRGGDIITTIDGRPAQSYTSDEIRRLFVRQGNKVELVLRRGAESFGCKVFLRRII